MKIKKTAKGSIAFALLAAAALSCSDSAPEAVDPGTPRAVETNGCETVDYDFTQMNRTVAAAYAYRLGTAPNEFSGKTFRISGIFLTRVDEEDGKRYFGCLIGDSGGCSCCAPQGVLEFIPKDRHVWPENFPPTGSRVTVTGRLKVFDEGAKEQTLPIPRLVDADISQQSQQ